MRASLRDVVFGAVVADAFGVPYEFSSRDTFEVLPEPVGFGSHHVPAGTWSDDSSMLLATCDSIRSCKGIDVADMRSRFEAWLDKGAYTPDGVVYDVGNTVSRALSQGYGCRGERDNGNGSLMRIAPLAFTDATDDQIREVSAITHAADLSCEACVILVRAIRSLAAGEPADAVVAAIDPQRPELARLPRIAGLSREEIASSGYVLHTIEAALWCLLGTGTYRECIMQAVALGGDTDTTACVAGALAGAAYGIGGIPASWLEGLRGKDLIEGWLF